MLMISLQIALPLLLLLWFAARPANGKLSYAIQLISVTSALLGLTFAALWAMPPFWMPYLYLGALVAIVIWQGATRRAGGADWWAAGKLQSASIAIVVLLGLTGAYLFTMAMLGRIPPDIETVDLAPPFGEGTYLVAHGGANTTVNVHMMTLDPAVPRFRAWRGQSRALDLFRITPAGSHMNGWYPEDPARYTTFGTPLLSPCTGRVALTVDGVVDNPVPVMNREHMAGNFIAIECSEDTFVILAHFQQGSIRVQPEQRVHTGDVLGAMGNSGNSSEPHLHIHAQRGLPPDAPLSGEPLAITINGRFLARNDQIRVAD